MPRIEVPPPWRAMSFQEWSEAIVAGVRGYLPDARAVRKGSHTVIIRHGERQAHLRNGDSFWISFTSATMATTMASLVDDRRDAFTVTNLAHSVLPDISMRRFTR